MDLKQSIVFKTHLRQVLCLLPHADLVRLQQDKYFETVVKTSLTHFAEETDGREYAEHVYKRMLTVLEGQVV